MQQQKKPRMVDYEPIESVDTLLQKMDVSFRTSTIQPTNLLVSLKANRYFESLFEVMLEKKDELAHTIQELRFVHRDLHNVDNMLEECFTNADLGGPTEEGDDPHSDIDEDYKQQIQELKQQYNVETEAINMNALAMEKKMKEIMANHRKFRPISDSDIEKAVNSVHGMHQNAAYHMKQQTCNQAMVLNNGCLDARRKRRNFSKEATTILQEFFNQNRDHPYPSDEEKQQLAGKCNITVQQVSNWFGNRRIRYKKAQNTGSDLETNSQIPMEQIVHSYSIDPSLFTTRNSIPCVPYAFDSQLPMFSQTMFDPTLQEVNNHNPVQISAVYSSSVATYLDQ